MTRHRSSGSYGHTFVLMGPDWYRLYWTVDFHYPSSRLRFPRVFSRDTDTAGATRFAKKWNRPQP